MATAAYSCTSCVIVVRTASVIILYSRVFFYLYFGVCLLSEVLRPSVNPLDQDNKHRAVRCFRPALLGSVSRLSHGFFFAKPQQKTSLADSFVWIQRDVLHPRLDHSRKQVDNQVGTLPNNQEGVAIVAVLSEFWHVLAGRAAHGFHHLLCQLHWGRVRFRVSS